jgi:hypothetical protein
MALPAMAFFNDSFDYPAGDLIPNGNWFEKIGTGNAEIIATSTGKVLKLLGGNYTMVFASSSVENIAGQINVDFKLDCAGVGSEDAQLVLYGFTTPLYITPTCADASSISYPNGTGQTLPTTTDSVWHNVGFSWSCQTGNDQTNYIIDGVLYPRTPADDCSNGFHKMALFANDPAVVYFDNVSDHEPISASSTLSDPVINTFFPADCSFNYFEATGSPATIDFEANINISNPVYSSTTWELIYFNFEDSYNSQTSQFPVAIHSAPDSIINVTTSVSLASSSYRVYYSLAGLNNGSLAYYMSYCDPTFLGTINVAQQLAIANMPAFTPEDCSGMATLERLVCNIRNDLKGLFYPTPLKVSQLKQNIDLIGSKFPFNYISVIKSFFQGVSDGLNKNEAISISIFGSPAGDLSFAPLALTTKAYGGSTLSILLYIKGFFTLLIFLIILKWFISYVKRVFK